MLGLPLYGYVSQSSKTVLHEIALPQPGFDVRAYAQQVLGLPDRGLGMGGRGLACPMPRARKEGDADEEEEERGEPNALHGAHARSKEHKVVSEAAAGDLSAYFGQQIPFNQLVALGALKKNSDGTYGEANGYTMGASRARARE